MDLHIHKKNKTEKAAFFGHLDEVFVHSESEDDEELSSATLQLIGEGRHRLKQLFDVSRNTKYTSATIPSRLEEAPRSPPSSSSSMENIVSGSKNAPYNADSIMGDIQAGETVADTLQRSSSPARSICFAGPLAPTLAIPSNLGLSFRGTIMLFIPNSRVNGARRLRMEKVAKYGAVVAASYKQPFTHVIVDKTLTATQVLKLADWTTVPPHIVVVNEFWTPDCILFNRLMDTTLPKYSVDGFSTKPQCNVTSLDIGEETTASPPSLQVKRPTGNADLRQPRLEETVSTEDTSTGPSVLSPTAIVAGNQLPALPTQLVPFRRDDTLDVIIAQAKNLGDVSLEEEDELAVAVGETPFGPNETLAKAWTTTFKCMHSNTTAAKTGPNDRTIVLLQKMEDFYSTTKDEWRAHGYRKAIAALRKHARFISTYDEARALPSVGDRLAKKIEEIAKTGELERLENLGEGYKYAQIFIKIYGCGPVQAARWVQQGFKTLQDVMDNGNPTLNQRIGIQIYDDLVTRISRDEVREHFQIVAEEGKRIDQELQFFIMGSYRRGAETCGDVDILVTKQDAKGSDLIELFNPLVNVLTKKNFLTHALVIYHNNNGHKWQGCSKLPIPGSLHRRIDFLLVPWQQRGAALLYFTGNDLFNRSLRLLASKKGFRLNEKGLFKNVFRGPGRTKITEGELVASESEEEIFQAIGTPFRTPSERCALLDTCSHDKFGALYLLKSRLVTMSSPVQTTKSKASGSRPITFEDNIMPRNTIKSLARTALPIEATIQKDALTALTKGSTVFISYLTTHANEIAMRKNRKTIMPSDVIDALKEVELSRFIPTAKTELEKFEAALKDRKDAKKKLMAKHLESIAGSGQTEGETDGPASKKAKLSETISSTSTVGAEVEVEAEAEAEAEVEAEAEAEEDEEEDHIEAEPEKDDTDDEEDADEPDEDATQLEDADAEPRFDMSMDRILEPITNNDYDEALDNGEDSD